MQIKDSHIARLFFIIFTVYFIQPFSLASGKVCSGNGSICIQKVCQLSSLNPTKRDGLKKMSSSKGVQVITISCETLMNTLPFELEFPKAFFGAIKSFLFKLVIHSPPYIQLITPPPNPILF